MQRRAGKEAMKVHFEESESFYSVIRIEISINLYTRIVAVTGFLNYYLLNPMPPFPTIVRPIFRTLALILAAFLVGLTHAQDDRVDSVFDLSPFELKPSQDQGYGSSYSVSASGLSHPIKDTPFSIEVINAAFIEDLGATDLEESLAYSSGVFLDDFTESNEVNRGGVNISGANETLFQSDQTPLGGLFDNAMTIRGFNVPQVYRDGFRHGGLIARYGTVLGSILDTSNVDRMEIVRGPNSVIYGNGSLSGFVNVIGKRPKGHAAKNFSVGFGNEGYLRTALDLTGPLSKNLFGGQLNYRVAIALEERDDWTDWRGTELEHYVGQLEWKTEKVRLLLEGQYADQREKGIGDQFIYDNLSVAEEIDVRNEFGENTNWTKELGERTETYRITGPDTYHLRREENFLADLEVRPLENLTLSAGVFLTDAQEEEFNVNVSTITNQESNFDLQGSLIYRVDDPRTLNSENLQKWLDDFVTVSPNNHIERAPVGGIDRDFADYRLVRYWWERIPERSVTEQYRLRAAYDFESRFFGDSIASHSFLIGRHDIKDELDLIVGESSIRRQFAGRRELASDDPIIVRNINEHRLIRYNGEALANPGEEFRHMEVWTTRHFGQYQGGFLDDRIGLTFEIGRERYHARDRLWDRFDESKFLGPEYRGLTLSDPFQWFGASNHSNETFGFFPTPTGQEEYFPNQTQAEDTTTRNLALNYRLGDNVTLYGTRSEGALPPMGLRDGNGEQIPAETSTNEEFGIKFRLLEGRLSGTLSAYRIKRDNAAWFLDVAPAPAKWGQLEDVGFEPYLITDGDRPLSYGMDRYYFEEEGVALRKLFHTIFDDEGNPIGRRFEFPEGLIGLEGFAIHGARQYTILDYAKLDLPAIDRDGNSTGKSWRYYLEKAFADRDRPRVLQPDNGGPFGVDPVPYNRVRGTTLDLSPSDRQSRGAHVTYTDQSEGVDMQLHYMLTDNWQMILSYAHTERKAVGGFNLLDTVDPDSGAVFGTEYDIWVRTFGREAFGLVERDTDGDGVVDTITKNGQPIGLGDVRPTDLNLNLDGINLYTGSENAASLWMNYLFNEGPLEGFSASIGGIYRGPAKTSTRFGGDDYSANPFGTPPTDDYFKVDTALRYQWNINQRSYALQLNVYNLLDETSGQSIINYTGENGSTQTRRTEVFYPPSSFRMSLSVDF